MTRCEEMKLTIVPISILLHLLTNFLVINNILPHLPTIFSIQCFNQVNKVWFNVIGESDVAWNTLEIVTIVHKSYIKLFFLKTLQGFFEAHFKFEVHFFKSCL